LPSPCSFCCSYPFTQLSKILFLVSFPLTNVSVHDKRVLAKKIIFCSKHHLFLFVSEHKMLTIFLNFLQGPFYQKRTHIHFFFSSHQGWRSHHLNWLTGGGGECITHKWNQSHLCMELIIKQVEHLLWNKVLNWPIKCRRKLVRLIKSNWKNVDYSSPQKEQQFAGIHNPVSVYLTQAGIIVRQIHLLQSWFVW